MIFLNLIFEEKRTHCDVNNYYKFYTVNTS